MHTPHEANTSCAANKPNTSTLVRSPCQPCRAADRTEPWAYLRQVVLARLATPHFLIRGQRQLSTARKVIGRARAREERPQSLALEVCKRCSQPSAAAPSIHIVTTHYLESLSWVLPVLSDNPRTRLYIYETGAAHLPDAIRSHGRVVCRDKSGALAQRDPFYSFFDHVARMYDDLPDYTLFMHGHDTHYVARMGCEPKLVLDSMQACCPSLSTCPD